MNGTATSVGAGQLGGYLNPMPKDFGLRVNAIDGGYLINNFAGGMATRTTLEETKQFVTDAFDAAFAPQPSADEQTPAEEGVAAETASQPEEVPAPAVPEA